MIVRRRASPRRSDELEERKRALGLLGRQFDGELIAKDVEDDAGVLGHQDGLSLSDVGRFHNRYPFPALHLGIDLQTEPVRVSAAILTRVRMQFHLRVTKSLLSRRCHPVTIGELPADLRMKVID